MLTFSLKEGFSVRRAERAALPVFRHEYKYVSPEGLLSSLQRRLSAFMPLDPHAEGGQYSIRSVYFDDLYDTCFLENEDGADPREKFRIRIYGTSKEHVTLELKRKERGKCLKTACPIPLETCGEILCGKIPRLATDQPYLLKKLICQMQFRALRPVVIVAYERVPFVWRTGNVRVTFDRNIRSSSKISSFFDEDLPCRPVLPAGVNMMEVKFDELLPDFIDHVLEARVLRQTAFSKYYLCRKFSMSQMISQPHLIHDEASQQIKTAIKKSNEKQNEVKQ